MFTITVSNNGNRKRFREFYTARNLEDISYGRTDKLREFIHGLNKRGIYPSPS